MKQVTHHVYEQVNLKGNFGGPTKIDQIFNYIEELTTLLMLLTFRSADP